MRTLFSINTVGGVGGTGTNVTTAA